MNPQADKLLAGLKAGMDKGKVSVPDATPMTPKVDQGVSQDKIEAMDKVFQPVKNSKIKFKVEAGTMPVPKNNNKDPENINSGEQAPKDRCVPLKLTFSKNK